MAAYRHPEIEWLAEKAIRGDKEALSKLCQKIAAEVLFKVSKIMGPGEGAEDIAQEVLIRVCKSIKTLRDAKSFNGWLSKIIVNEKNRYLAEKTKNVETQELDEYVENLIAEERDSFLPGSYLENEELSRTISAFVDELPMRQREAVMLHYYDSLSVTETAEAMGVKVACVSVHLALAHEKLKNKLKEQPLMAERLRRREVSPGAILAGALYWEGAQFAVGNAAFAQQAAAACQELIFLEATVVSTASAASGSSALVCICGTAIAACIMAVSLAWPGSLPEPYQPLDAVSIHFQGGQSYGEAHAHINPEDAQIYFDEDREIIALDWWITAAGSDEVLYRGNGMSVGEALALLRERELSGEYKLFFQLKTDGGATYKAYSNFFNTP